MEQRYDTESSGKLQEHGTKPGKTKTRQGTMQKEIKNRSIQTVTEEVRENITRNRTRLVWARINQLKENKGTAQRNMELRCQHDRLKSTLTDILQITKTNIQKYNKVTKTPLVKTESQLNNLQIGRRSADSGIPFQTGVGTQDLKRKAAPA